MNGTRKRAVLHFGGSRKNLTAIWRIVNRQFRRAYCFLDFGGGMLMSIGVTLPKVESWRSNSLGFPTTNTAIFSG
jgi:hypothetical protein